MAQPIVATAVLAARSLGHAHTMCILAEGLLQNPHGVTWNLWFFTTPAFEAEVRRTVAQVLGDAVADQQLVVGSAITCATLLRRIRPHMVIADCLSEAFFAAHMLVAPSDPHPLLVYASYLAHWTVADPGCITSVEEERVALRVVHLAMSRAIDVYAGSAMAALRIAPSPFAASERLHPTAQVAWQTHKTLVTSAWMRKAILSARWSEGDCVVIYASGVQSDRFKQAYLRGVTALARRWHPQAKFVYFGACEPFATPEPRDTFDARMQCCKLLISTAGTGVPAECGYLGTPCLLVPAIAPIAGGEQMLNAAVAAHGCPWIACVSPWLVQALGQVQQRTERSDDIWAAQPIVSGDPDVRLRHQKSDPHHIHSAIHFAMQWNQLLPPGETSVRSIVRSAESIALDRPHVWLDVSEAELETLDAEIDRIQGAARAWRRDDETAANRCIHDGLPPAIELLCAYVRARDV